MLVSAPQARCLRGLALERCRAALPCGMLSDPGGVTGLTHPWAVRALAALARRSIAAGVGCDAQLQAAAAGVARTCWLLYKS